MESIELFEDAWQTLVLWQEMKALVLCAGYGTRLGGLTRDVPKPMLPICGEPLLAHTLRYLARQGFDQVAINLHFKSRMIVDYLGDGSQFGVAICYSYEDVLLGTAGAVKRLEGYFSDVDDLLVMYGDLLIDQDLRPLLAFHREKQAHATLLLHQRPGSNSLVDLDASCRITGFLERPTKAQRQAVGYPWVYSGLHMMHSNLTDLIPLGRAVDFPRDLFAKQLDALQVYGFPLTGYRCAIDSPERYEEAQRAGADGRYSLARPVLER